MDRGAWTRGALTLAAAVALSGCVAMTVRHDYDPDVAFDRYRTFAWMPLAEGETIGAGSLSGPFLEKHIKKAVVETLAARGYQYQPEGADFLVAYQLRYRNKRSVEVYGHGYSPYLYRGPTEAVEVRRLKEGTLVLDLVDPANQELIWRGWSVTDLSPGSSPEDEHERLDLAVTAILERFPPYPQRR